MALFLSVDIHQGDERFSVHFRGKQCAFMSLSALLDLTARNIPLNSWSSVTFKNALLQGDKMFLNALDSGFIILDPGVEFLSVENLPTVVNVACRNLFNDFSCEICQTPVQAKTTASPVSVIDTDLPIVVESVEVQTNLDPPIVVEPVEATTIIDPPIVVEPVEAQTIIDPPIVVEPVEAQTIIDLPIEAQTNIDPPIEEQSITDMPDDAENENQICLINYGAEFQGLVITDCEIECHYYDIHTALLNTFISDSYAIVILQGYMMALVKQTDNFYVFDSHARDSYGMPDPNGTAVVMKFCNIHELEQYLYCLSIELHSNIFEVVPEQLNICKASKQKTKHVNDQEYQNKRLSVETEGATQARLSKASQYKKRKQSEETNSERQIRLQKERESKKRKQSEETDSERQVRLQKERESKKRKRSEETDSERQVRLQKDKMSKKRKLSEESDSERQVRLQKVREYEKRKQSKKLIVRDKSGLT